MNQSPVGTQAFAPGLLDKDRIRQRLEEAGQLSKAIKSQTDALRSVLADLTLRAVKTDLTDADLQEIRPDLTIAILGDWLTAAQDLIAAYDLVRGVKDNRQAWAAMELK